MQNHHKLPLLLLLFISYSCSNTTKPLYSEKSTAVIQRHSEDSVKKWIHEYAAFPDSYIPLLFEKAGIGSAYNKGFEIIPLRRYTIEHTFEIRNKNYELTNATLVFQLTPDYFVQRIRYKKTNFVSLEHRVFPPDYSLWTELYGRKLTESDTMRWKEKNREQLSKLSEKFTFNRHIDPAGENEVLTDSLVRELNNVYHNY